MTKDEYREKIIDALISVHGLDVQLAVDIPAMADAVLEVVEQVRKDTYRKGYDDGVKMANSDWP